VKVLTLGRLVGASKNLLICSVMMISRRDTVIASDVVDFSNPSSAAMNFGHSTLIQGVYPQSQI